MIERHHTNKAQRTITLVLPSLVVIALLTQLFDVSIIAGPLRKTFPLPEPPQIYPTEFNCSLKCSETSPLTTPKSNSLNDEAPCPEYFRWIHEDLKPWKVSRITREMVEKAKNFAHMRIVIVNGRLYTEKYKEAFQTRDVVTIWGILQLLRLYPGRIPDLDLMFEFDDKPVIRKRDYGLDNASVPPPLFHYCGEESNYDIVFPDWSFWGWPEVNIKPWELVKEDLKQGNRKIKWTDRQPYAYWKGNSQLGSARHGLVKCNASSEYGHDWKARIFHLQWSKEKMQGFSTSDLANQCTHRYKIYVEGISWSVSQKYILACDSMSLVVNPRYYDFFTRSLLPTIHYWPIEKRDMCGSIKFAVEWGEKHKKKAQEIGKAGSNFVQESLRMQYVYDYCFHLLTEYSKLLKYKPTVPRGAVEMCPETSLCFVKGIKRRFRKQSMVKAPSNLGPCSLSAPYDPAAFHAFLERKQTLNKDVIILAKRSGNASTSY